MNQITDTICAISTPPGAGGIAVARVSGDRALDIVGRIWAGKPLDGVASHTVHLGEIVDPDSGVTLDRGVATVYRSPRSYTGEDTVELSVHGSPWIQRELINLLIRQGAVMAGRGEYTRRALQNGKLDLAEAEGVADMISASSRIAQQIALAHMKGDYSAGLERMRAKLVELCSLVELELDFSEEDVEFADRQQLVGLAREIYSQVSRLADSFAAGRALKEGVAVAIVGATNAGKSTLLNSLLGENRAIVSDIHGTTRDVIEDTVEIGDILYRFIDTAGLRPTDDPIESIGISRSISVIEKADVLLWIIDPSSPGAIERSWHTVSCGVRDGVPIIAVINKCDLGLPVPSLPAEIEMTVGISALNGEIKPLTDALASLMSPKEISPELTVTNARHYQALIQARTSISRAIASLESGIPGDLLAQDLRETARHLASITSPITTPDLLSHVFTHFCVGK